MNKRRLRNNGSRPKAFLGIGESAAILAAAGINAATQMAAAGMNSAATRDSAQRQAQASIQAAQRQAEALKEQSEKSKELQTESQEFIKDENAENRELQKDIQMQLQMLTGQQNINDRLEASKIKVALGGNINKYIKPNGRKQSLLRGGNIKFKLPHSGTVDYEYTTPEGGELYELNGKSHAKGGIDVDTSDGFKFNAEGDEKIYALGGQIFVLSKHDIDGFNAAKATDRGMHPLQAYFKQEYKKEKLGLNDDGTKKAKFGKRKFLAGGTPILYNINGMNTLNYSSDTIGDAVTGVAYGSLKDKEEFKYGGKKRCLRNGGRVKAAKGLYWGWGLPKVTADNIKPTVARDMFFNQKPNINTSSITGSTSQPRQSFWSRTGNFINKNADLIGAGINGLANIGGAFITSAANRAAENILSEGYNRSAGIMRDAYNSLTGIDPNIVNKRDYRAGHMMASLQAPVSFANTQIAGVDRSLQRRLRNAGRYSASGAAAQNRMTEAEIDTQDLKNKIYSADQQQMQTIRKENADRLTEASRMNAYLDTQANQQYAQDRLELEKYNNQVDQTKILGAAGAESEANLNIASNSAQTRAANAAAWSNALGNIGLTASNTLSTMAKRKADLENTMLGATTDAQINQIARNGSRREKQARLDAVRAAINSGKLSSEDEAKYRYYEELLLKSV